MGRFPRWLVVASRAWLVLILLSVAGLVLWGMRSHLVGPEFWWWVLGVVLGLWTLMAVVVHCAADSKDD